MLKVSIVGSVGIPARYGGFETLVQYLTYYLGRKLDITVYCSGPTYRNDKRKSYNKAHLKYIPLSGNGIQSVIYDIVSFIHAVCSSDVVLVLGVSGSIILPFYRIFNRTKRIITNIDGLEHKRQKWSKLARAYLKFSERMAVKYSDVVLSDNKAIQRYVKQEYGIDSVFIPYGGDHVEKIALKDRFREKYRLPNTYAFKVCRIEPENNIHLVLEAFNKMQRPLVVVGNWDNSKYGRQLREKYADIPYLILLDPIYNQKTLNQLRSNATLYIHGHSAGGTNPALLEAMSLGLPVFAFDCPYNRETTYDKAVYFRDEDELYELISTNGKQEMLRKLGQEMYVLAHEQYTWDKITRQYMDLFLSHRYSDEKVAKKAKK